MQRVARVRQRQLILVYLKVFFFVNVPLSFRARRQSVGMLHLVPQCLRGAAMLRSTGTDVVLRRTPRLAQ